MLTGSRRRGSRGPAAAADPAALQRIDADMAGLYTMIADRLEMAVDAFLLGERGAAATLVASDPDIDRREREVELQVQHELAGRAELSDPAFAHLVLVLLIAPELERSADLVEHIALRTGHGLERHLSPLARELVTAMARAGATMWRAASQAFLQGDSEAAERLRRVDDELDDLHVRLSAELAVATLPVSSAIELGLVARFLERLGDHAVNVTRRIPGAVPTGEGPRP